MKRFVFSFLALVLAIFVVFTLQISLAQTLPNTNPPAGNNVPNLSGLNVIGNATFTGSAEFGNSIKPKAPATTLGVAGKLNVTNGLDVTGKVNVTDELNVNQFFTASKDGLQVKMPAHFNDVVNLNSNVNVKGNIAFPGKVSISGPLTAVGDVNFPNGVQVGIAGNLKAGTLDVLLPATFSNNVTIGDAYVATLHAKTAGQPITISDKLKLSDLEVGGNQTVSNGKITAKNIDVTTDLNVTGKVNIQNIYPKTAGQSVNVNGALAVTAGNLTILQAVDIKGEIQNSSGAIKINDNLQVLESAIFSKSVDFSQNINLLKNIVPVDKVLEIDGKVKINKFNPADNNEYESLQMGRALFELKTSGLRLKVDPIMLQVPFGPDTPVPSTDGFEINSPVFANSLAAQKIGSFALKSNSINLNKKNLGISAYPTGFHEVKSPSCDSGYIVISCNGGFSENNADTKSPTKLDYLGSKMTSISGGEQSCTAFVRKNENLTINVNFQVQAMCFNPSVNN